MALPLYDKYTDGSSLGYDPVPAERRALSVTPEGFNPVVGAAVLKAVATI